MGERQFRTMIMQSCHAASHQCRSEHSHAGMLPDMLANNRELPTTEGGGRMRSQRFRGNVFVANLPPEFTDDELAESFDPFGMVLRASIARDPANGKRLRYGFVDIATERAANLAVAAMNGTKLHGFTLDVRISE